MNLYVFIKPMGIVTFLCLLITFAMGFFKWQFKHHKKMAIITLIAAAIHTVLVVLVSIFY